MAKLILNPLVAAIYGRVAGAVIKRSPHGPVISGMPNMDRVRWSPAQVAHRNLLRQAGWHYRTVMADPKEKARLTRLAKEARIPVSAYVMGRYLKQAAQAAREKRADLENTA